MSAIDICLNNNSSYASSFTGAGLEAPPSRHLTIITCMDARIDPIAMLGLAAGEANILRNAGGIVTDDVLRSLALSQNVLGTREVMIIQHTDCGLLRFAEKELKDRIECQSGARPEFGLGAFSNLEDSLRRSIGSTRASRFLSSKHMVRGFVYDVRSGLLSEVV